MRSVVITLGSVAARDAARFLPMFGFDDIPFIAPAYAKPLGLNGGGI